MLVVFDQQNGFRHITTLALLPGMRLRTREEAMCCAPPVLLMMPTAREFSQLGTLLWREYLGNVHQCGDNPLGGGVCELQFRLTEVPKQYTINCRLCQRLAHPLTVLVMLRVHWHQVLDGRLDDRLDLLALLITGLN